MVTTNPPTIRTHLALVAFEEFIESKLGDKYDVEVFPSELLGSQNEMVQLTQTGAINLCGQQFLAWKPSAITTNCSIPFYLFASSEAYHASMDDEAITGPIFESTKQAGFEAVTGWMRVHATSIRSIGRSGPPPT